MIRKSLVALVVILGAAAMVFAASENISQNNSSNSSLNLSNNQQELTNLSDKTNTMNNNSIKSDNQKSISQVEAKTIAQKYIKEPKATTGTPILNKTNGIYTVPVKINGSNVGEIYIDASTGKNLGGAGGAPTEAYPQSN